jgi:hypothetical protein
MDEPFRTALRDDPSGCAASETHAYQSPARDVLLLAQVKPCHTRPTETDKMVYGPDLGGSIRSERSTESVASVKKRQKAWRSRALGYTTPLESAAPRGSTRTHVKGPHVFRNHHCRATPVQIGVRGQ